MPTKSKALPPSSSDPATTKSASLPSSDKLSKEERDIIRRRRNVQSAKRSREKRNQEHRWVQLQVMENEDRIRYLESQVDSLTQELVSSPPVHRPSSSSKGGSKKTSPTSSSSSSSSSYYSSSSSRPNGGVWKQGEQRPAWFGDPF